MVHAWLVIEPRDGDGVGIQRMYTGSSYSFIHNEMWDDLLEIGAIPHDFIVGSTDQEDELQWRGNPGTDTGLLWKTMPCTSDGTNLDVEPQEPSGE